MFGFHSFGSGEFNLFGVFTAGIILCILGVFVFILVRGIRQWHKNNNSPRLTVDARVVSRRSDTHVSQTPVGGDITGAHGFTTSSDTTYFVTFEYESGDRQEFTVPYREYGYLAEGDMGRLTFQGTRYLGFERY